MKKSLLNEKFIEKWHIDELLFATLITALIAGVLILSGIM